MSTPRRRDYCSEGEVRPGIRWQLLAYKQVVTWEQEQQDLRYERVKKKFESNDNVVIMREPSQIALETFDDNYFDWVYIDGDHSTEAVLKDLKLCLKKVLFSWGIFRRKFLGENS